MKTIYKITVLGVFILALFTSCKEEEKYSISIPKIDSAAITPTTFTFGDNVTLTASLSDPDCPLATLDISVVANNQSISTQTIQIGEGGNDVNQQIQIPLTSNLKDNTEVKVVLTLKNTLKGEVTQEITGLTGNRPYFDQLYLVQENGDVYTLTPKSGNKDQYENEDIILPKSFAYRIAQKITPDKQIDFSGLVWGTQNGAIQCVQNNGDPIFAHANDDYTTGVLFDNLTFTTTLNDASFAPSDLRFDAFENPVTVDGEDFNVLSVSLQKDEELTVFPVDAVYNVDFFDRIGPNKVKFLGETGNYDLYYSPSRKSVTVWAENPSYPDYLLMTGGGLGYPTKVTGIAIEHTWWGFDNIRNFILFRKISDNVFQGTMMIHAKDNSWVAFKPFKDTGWGGEIQANTVSFTGGLLEGDDDNNNWCPTIDVDPTQTYRVTIDVNNNTVNIVKFTLP